MSSKGKKVTTGYWYYMGLHFGVCHGPVDALTKVIVGDREAWTGNITASGGTTINAPKLFGGEKREGGVSGPLTVMMGESTQAPNSYLATQQGTPQPAYRGIMSLVFDGKVTANNPYIKNWAFKVKRVLQGWAQGSAWYSAKADIAGDMNPAHIIYQCLTDPVWGMGYPVGSIDGTSFNVAADTLYSENFGLSMLWNQQQTIEDFLKIVFDHIGGVLYVTQDTGRFAIKLIRDDYVKANLPQFGPSNLLDLTEYQRRGWGETANEVTVVYVDRDTNKEAGVTLQDLANIATQGQVVSQTRRYPGIANAALAQRVAMRDLLNVSLPVSRAKLIANRSAWNIIPGDPIRVTWPEFGIDDVVFRVMEVNRGELRDGAISLEVVEDVFALPTNTYVQEQDPLWVSPNSNPLALTYRRLLEAPYWELARTLSDADLAYLATTASYLLTCGARNAGDAFNYAVEVSGVETTVADFCPTGTLQSSLLAEVTTSTTIENLIDADDVVTGTYAVIVGATQNEYVRVDTFNPSTGAITLTRGIFDTVPTTHTAGARIWFADGFQGVDPTEYATGQGLSVEMLPTTSLGQLASAPADNITMVGRQYKPYPPGNFTVDGQRYPTSLDAGLQLAVSWSTRNRLTQTASIITQTNGNITPEAGETYSLEVKNNDTQATLYSVTGLTGTSHNVTGLPSGSYNVKVTLWSVRNGVPNYQYQIAIFAYTNIFYRITEAGDQRITEALDVRIT